jgi:CRP-like cAMP-binding protein
MSIVQATSGQRPVPMTEPVKPVEGVLTPLVLRLAALDSFDAKALGAIRSLGLQMARTAPDHDIVHECRPQKEVTVLLSGLAYRGKTLADGSRQMSGLLLPGDICDFSFLSSIRSTQSVTTLVPSLIARFPVASLLSVARDHGAYLRAMLRAAALDNSIAQEHMIRLSARDARQRMSHWLCEIAVRLDVVHQKTAAGGYIMPLTQSQIGELLGLSAVHVNRTLQTLRRENLVKFSNGVLTILDRAGLETVAGFQPGYLNPTDGLTRAH